MTMGEFVIHLPTGTVIDFGADDAQLVAWVWEIEDDLATLKATIDTLRDVLLARMVHDRLTHREVGEAVTLSIRNQTRIDTRQARLLYRFFEAKPAVQEHYFTLEPRPRINRLRAYAKIGPDHADRVSTVIIDTPKLVIGVEDAQPTTEVDP